MRFTRDGEGNHVSSKANHGESWIEMSAADPIPTPRTPATELELLVRYHRDGDFAARSEFIERAMPIVHFVVRRYTQRGESDEDLVQAGSIGLLKAVDRFDVDRGVQFATFAIPNIVGEIRRHFRDRGWAVRVPRGLQERHAQLTRATEQLTSANRRTPSIAELAEATGLTKDQVLETLDGARNYTAVSLDAPIDEDGSAHDLLGSRDDGFEQVDRRLVAILGMRALRERERKIVALRFYEGLTQTEIAERMGISQMHVSRLLRAALDDMRDHIELDALEHPDGDVVSHLPATGGAGA
jgi:RNA polymerase sigma-B factor